MGTRASTSLVWISQLLLNSEIQGADWTTKLEYHDHTGRLEAIEVVEAAAKTSVLHMTYERDLNGSINRRTELVEGRDEIFHLNGHQRLKEWLLDYQKGWAGSGNQASIYTYDAIDKIPRVKTRCGAKVSSCGNERNPVHTRALRPAP